MCRIGEEIEDPIQRLVCVVGVQRGQAGMPSLDIGNGLLHGLPIPYLTNHDRVGSLAHRIAQRALVAADLTRQQLGFDLDDAAVLAGNIHIGQGSIGDRRE